MVTIWVRQLIDKPKKQNSVFWKLIQPMLHLVKIGKPKYLDQSLYFDKIGI